MNLRTVRPELVVVIGGGGVGKTTLAAAMALVSAGAGHDTLVMTFDPSWRLKDALGVGTAAGDEEVRVARESPGELRASLLDARRTFDGVIGRYAPDEATRQRILGNRYYDQLAGHLGGILEYMAVERLYEVATEERFARVVLDTPPTRQAIDFLEAPRRIVDFLDSGALRVALRPWFDDRGGLRAPAGLGFVGRRFERFLDRVVGLGLLRDMSEFFRAFAPLFDGFRRRALQVEKLLASERTLFVLVTGPGIDRVPDTLLFARRLRAMGYRLGPLIVNRVHPEMVTGASSGELAGVELLRWLGERDRRGLERLRSLLPAEQAIVTLPLTPDEPTDLAALGALGDRLQRGLIGG